MNCNTQRLKMMNDHKTDLKRREILKTLSIGTGAVVFSGATAAFLGGCKADPSPNWKPKVLTGLQALNLERLVDRIIPVTDTPGAVDALVHRYIDEALKNNFSKEDRSLFIGELDSINDLSKKKFKKDIYQLMDAQTDELLTELADEWKKSDNQHIFKKLRDMTVTGYVKSEEGATKHFVYDPVPGPYKGCIDFASVGRTYSL